MENVVPETPFVAGTEVNVSILLYIFFFFFFKSICLTVDSFFFSLRQLSSERRRSVKGKTEISWWKQIGAKLQREKKKMNKSIYKMENKMLSINK